MEFERQRRLAGLWNWLPVFRAAAEYESLQRAALAMGVSPSAVSRTIRLLESALGFAVFERLASGVRLTARGERLLGATRDAMRWVDDTLEPLARSPGAQRLGAVGPYLPALVARAAGGALERLTVVDGDAIADALLRGDVDLVLSHQRHDGGELASERVGVLRLVAASHGPAPELVAPRLPGLEAGPGPLLRVDELSAMLAVASARRCAVLVPPALAPRDATQAPHSAQVEVWVVSRVPLAEPTPPPEFFGALRELLGQ